MGMVIDMAFYEEKAKRNGVVMPIQCIRMEIENTGRVAIRLHYHEYTELLFAIDGEGLVYVGDTVYPFKAGDMIIVPTGEPHDVRSPQSSLSYIVVKFLPQILRADEETFSEYSYTALLLENADDRQLSFSDEELGETDIPNLFAHLIQEWDAQRFGYELSLRADVTLIYLYILRRWRKNNFSLMQAVKEEGQYELLQKAISFVKEHYADLTEKDVADACGVSAAYFSRVFKRTMKVSFSAYLAGVRLREARRLLLLTEHSVTDIAQTVGFSTASYFISLFRKEHNMTPYQYRRTNRG